ncbi:MAG: NfeD family protein [Candidatus Rokuibacteriota bacterium]
MKPFGLYLLWQAPGWVLAALVLGWIVPAFGLPGWVAGAVVALVVVKDLALYPALRAAFSPPPYRSAPIGATGEAIERLAPSGYIRVNGELWLAEIRGEGGAVPRGARVHVRDSRGITLVVESIGSAAP